MPTNNFPQLVFDAGKIALQQTPRAHVKQGRKHMDNGLYELYDNREIIETRDKAALINKHDQLEEMGKTIEGNTTQFFGSLQHMSRATTFKKQAKNFEDDVKKTSDESKKDAIRKDIENAGSGAQGLSHTTIDAGAGRGQRSGRGSGRDSARPLIPTSQRVQAIRESIAAAQQQETASQQSPQNSSQGSHQNPVGQGSWVSGSASPVTQGNASQHSPRNPVQGSHQSPVPQGSRNVGSGAPVTQGQRHGTEGNISQHSPQNSVHGSNYSIIAQASSESHSSQKSSVNEPYGPSRDASESSNT